MGVGGWSLLGPVRFALSLFYGLHARMVPAPAARGSASGPKIISVGNIEVGGGGKTPCVLSIASALRARGHIPAVVTRGYGGNATRNGGGSIAVPGNVHTSDVSNIELPGNTISSSGNTDKEGAFPAGYSRWTGGSEVEASVELGDEAVLYIRAALPLAVDRDRARGIRAVKEAAGATHVILDDAFHRTALPKDLDILLLDAERPFGNGWLLPYGTLREPASAATRAGAVIFTRATGRSVPDEAARFVAGKPVFFARHEPCSLRDRDGERLESAEIAGSKVALFSGIARAVSFEKTAVDFGLDPYVSFRYDDHHEYTDEDISGMVEECGKGTVFITTGKDLAKVAALFPKDVRLLVLDMKMVIDGIDELLEPVI